MLLVINVLGQGAVINAYFIKEFPDNKLLYLWFIPDILCASLFSVAMVLAFQHLKWVHYGDKKVVLKGMFAPVSHEMKRRFSVYYFGVHPLSYTSWLFYSAILLAKIFSLVNYDIMYHLKTGVVFGQQTLLVVTSLAGLTFFFLVEGHTWASRNSHRYVFVTLICAWMALEIVDTVTLLSYLYVYSDNKEVNATLERFLIGVCMVSFFLPSIHLYMLSMTDRSADVLELPIATLGDIMHVLLLDLPYLGVRSYLLANGDNTVIVLMLKNVFFIIFQLRHIVPDCHESIRRMWFERKALRFRRRLARLYEKQLSAETGNRKPSAASSKRAGGRASRRRPSTARASAATAATEASQELFTVQDFADALKRRVSEEELLRQRRERHEQRREERLRERQKDQRNKATQTRIMPIVDTLWNRGYPRMRGTRVRIDQNATKYYP